MNIPSPDTTPAHKSSAWRSLGVVAVAGAIVVAGLWAWRASRPAPAAWAGGGPIDVAAVTVQAEAAPATLQALGELQSVRQVLLPAEVAGRVAAIRFESGRAVQAGAVLVQLDDAVEQADLRAAKAAVAFARQQLARATELAATGAMSREILQQRLAEHDQREAQVQQLEARIRQKRILAPFSGQLGLRRIDLGQYLSAGEAVVSLTDLDRLHVNFDVPQQELSRVRIGQQVQVDTGTPGLAPALATVSAIEPQVGRDTRNASVQATLPNAGRALRPGMYATVAVALPAEPDALLVPATAVLTSPSGDTALLVRELADGQVGKAEFAPVTVGRRIGERVVVTRGLEPGDVVVTEGQLRAQPGAPLRVVARPANGEPS